MPRIAFTPESLHDLEHVREFLIGKNPEAWARATKAIQMEISALATKAGIHKPVEDRPFQYDLKIKFGASGYLVRYQHEKGGDVVIILRIRHFREQDFL